MIYVITILNRALEAERASLKKIKNDSFKSMILENISNIEKSIRILKGK